MLPRVVLIAEASVSAVEAHNEGQLGDERQDLTAEAGRGRAIKRPDHQEK